MSQIPLFSSLSTHDLFVRALQHEPLPCSRPQCPGPVQATDASQVHDRVKRFHLHCERCGHDSEMTGREQLTPPWDDAAMLTMADEHLMHQQPTCPFDGTPVVFHSLPNPRRRARYRLACFFCGRQADMDWPPSESRR
ncbi:MAG: hypothetical protein HZB35_04520 [Nitrospirae bacterium]|nr:hypothetical protein [Nitrospirota bacterium]